jgi:hypothetical protein
MHSLPQSGAKSSAFFCAFRFVDLILGSHLVPARQVLNGIELNIQNGVKANGVQQVPIGVVRNYRLPLAHRIHSRNTMPA